jgi:hypothetical protein
MLVARDWSGDFFAYMIFEDKKVFRSFVDRTKFGTPFEEFANGSWDVLDLDPERIPQLATLLPYTYFDYLRGKLSDLDDFQFIDSLNQIDHYDGVDLTLQLV